MQRVLSRAWIAGAIVVGALSAGSASAATYSVHNDFSIGSDADKKLYSDFKWTQGASDRDAGRVSIRGFDSRLGELNSVDVKVMFQQKGSLDVKAQTSNVFLLNFKPTQVWAMGDGAFTASLFGSRLTSSSLSMKSECEDSFTGGYGGGCSGAVQRSTSGQGQKTFTGSYYTKRFLDTQVSLNLLATANVSVACDNITFPNCAYPEARYDNWVTGSVWVTYTYTKPAPPPPPQPPEPPITPVPVPPALPMMGAVVGMLALLRRRRRAV